MSQLSSVTMQDDKRDRPLEVQTNGSKTDKEKNKIRQPKTEALPSEDEYLSGIITGAHGDVYQRELALVMFERATRKEYNFRLGYEMTLADKFDDVAFFNKVTSQWVLVQTKHADTSKSKSTALRFDMLFPLDDATRDKGDFSLFKYLKSYVSIQANIRESKNVIIFTNRDFLANDLEQSVEVEFRQVDEILQLDGAKHIGLKVSDKKVEEMLNYTNREFNSLSKSIAKLFTEGVMDQAIKHFKIPIARMLTKTNTFVKFREDPPTEALQMLKSLSDVIDIRNTQLSLSKCKDLFSGNSRNKTLPPFTTKEIVYQFFKDLVLCIRQPDDIRETIEQDLRLWMRAWIRPQYLIRLEASQLKMGAVWLDNFFNEKQSQSGQNGSSYKKFLQLTDGKEFFRRVEEDLEKQICSLSNYNATNTSQYYVSRQIELATIMPDMNDNRIRDDKFVERLLSGRFDKQQLFLLTAEPGMGKSTILDYIAFEAQKKSNAHVYLFNLNTFHEKLTQIKDSDADDQLLLVLRLALSDENFVSLKETIALDKNSKTKHIVIFDALDEVFPDNRPKVLQLFREMLKAKNVKILVSARRTVKALVEKEFRVKSMSLVPFNDHDQTDFLRQFWKVAEVDEDRFLEFKTHLFKVFHSEINRALNEFTGIPLMLKMLGEVYGDQFEKYLQSEQSNLSELMHEESLSTITLYEKFVRKCFDNRMVKKSGVSYQETDDDNIVLFENFTLEHQLLAIKHLKISILGMLLKNDNLVKRLNRVEDRITKGIERSPLVEAFDGSYRFIHQSYAEFLAAKFLILDIEKYKAQFFHEYLQASLFIEYPMIRIFFFALIETHFKTDHLKIIGRFYKKNSDIALWACEVYGQKTVESLLRVKCNTAITNRLLCVAAEHNCYNICKYLFKNHRKMIKKNFIGWKPLDGNVVTNGWNPLHIAARNGHSDVINLIVENSGNVNVRNDRLWTPICNASLKGQLQSVKTLIEKSADVNVRDNVDGTPLHCASCLGHADVVKLLVEHSANVNAQNNKGITPLHSAAQFGHTKVVAILVANSVDLDTKTNDGATPLHVASEAGHTEIVKLLNDGGWNGNLADNKGWTPFHYAAQNSHVEVVNILIANFQDINAKTQDGRTPLHLASEDGNTEIVRLLISYHCQVNAKDIYCWTPLHYAAASGNVEIVTLLIDKFEDINEVGRFEKTPLHLASEYGHADIVRLLVENSGNVDNADEDGYMPLHFAAEYGHTEVVEILVTESENIDSKTETDRSPLHIAAENGHTKVVQILIANFADVNAIIDYDRTALHYACKNGHSETVKTLIEHKANVNAKDIDDWTPLHYAAQNGHTNVVKVLIGNGGSIPAQNDRHDAVKTPTDHSSDNVKAKDIGDQMPHNSAVESSDVNAKTDQDWLPLHCAAKNGHQDVVQLLIGTNADTINAKDIDDWTPLHYAARNSHANVAKVLLDHAADVNAKNDRGAMPLHYAAENGHQSVVELLLSYSSVVHVKEKDNDGCTPLKLAAKAGHSNIVKLLNRERKHRSLSRSYLMQIPQLLTTIRNAAMNVICRSGLLIR